LNYNILHLKKKNLALTRFLKNREGTAEVIGTIMFIVILLFFFTNVYLWHDAASKDMNEFYVKKTNAGMSISFNGATDQVTLSSSSSEITLSRFWIDTNGIHVYADLSSSNVQIAPGPTNAVTITFAAGQPNSDGSVNFNYNQQSNLIKIYYSPSPSPQFAAVNTLGVIVST